MQIKWSKRAIHTLDKVLAFGMELFGAHHSILFYNKIKAYEPLLASNPYMGKIEPLLINRKGHKYRSLVIHEHFKLIYIILICHKIFFILLTFGILDVNRLD